VSRPWPIQRWSDAESVAERFARAGLSLSAARQKASLLGRIAEWLRQEGEIFQGGIFDGGDIACRGTGSKPGAAVADSNDSLGGSASDGPVQVFFVPGRIEVLGKHTDYAGGRSMVAAVERGFCVAVRPRRDDLVIVADALRREWVRFKIGPDLVPPVGHWSNYPMTVARRLARNFPTARHGAEVIFASDLPPAAGMSSSSALVVAMFLALRAANPLDDQPLAQPLLSDKTALAGYLGCIENGQSFGELAGDRGVGTFGGSEDHTAILCARPGQIGQYSYCPISLERLLPVPEGYVFAIASSGVVAEKTGAALDKYNAASRMTGCLLQLWRQATARDDPHLAAAISADPDAASQLYRAVVDATDEQRQGFSTAALIARLEQFIAESQQIVPAAGDALERGDLAALAAAVDRSQRLAEQLLGNQTPETVHLARSARQLGAAAASAFGAGFGGSVWALVDHPQAAEFLQAWSASYRQAFPHRAAQAEFFTTAAGPGAFQLPE